MQNEDDPIDLIYSPLQQIYTEGVHAVEVLIYQFPQRPWTLEVFDMFDNSTVWDDQFATDQAALDEFFRIIEEEGIESLIGKPADSIQGLAPEIATNLMHLMLPLSSEELQELEDFLFSAATSDEAMSLETLDGYLTGFAIGPTNIHVNQWYPGIWGGREEDAPAFESFEQSERIMKLIMRHFNGIIWSVQEDPDTHQPLFDHFDSKEYIDAEMWCYGFIQAMEFCRKDWQPLFDDPNGPTWLHPIKMLGDEMLDEGMESSLSASKREELALQISASISAIFRFWLPYRKAILELELAKSYQMQHPIIASDDACPCGSGEMFKQCCGTASTKH
jgi:uncharacterized protein